MAILSDKDIKKHLEEGKIYINPLKDPDKQIQPASVDLRLSNEFKQFKNPEVGCLDSKRSRRIDELMEGFTIKENEPIIIHPGQFLLGNTIERVSLPNNLVGRIVGRSSLGRLGITVHVTAGYIDPGFTGTITLEISNIGKVPVALYRGQRVCQLAFETMTSQSIRPYGHPDRDSKYMEQTVPEASRINMDYEVNK